MKRQSILTPKSAIGDPEPSAAGMVERVARAIHDAEFQPGQPLCRSDYEAARAAIAAMREPSEGMKEASDADYNSYDSHMNDLLSAWKRMIDAALAEDTA